MAQVPFYNPTTGESWTAPSGGYAPPPGWVRGSPPQTPSPQFAPEEAGIGDFMRRQRDGTLTQEDIMARQRAFEAGQRPPPMGQPGAPLGGRPPQQIGAQRAPATVPPPGTSSQTLNTAIGFVKEGLEQLRGGFQLTPEQNQQIETAIDAARARAQTDAERVRSENLRTLFDEVAPSLGLRPGDTPNLDRAGRVLAEHQRQVGNINRELAGREAQLKLDYPIASGQAAALARAQQAQSMLGLGEAQSLAGQRYGAARQNLLQELGSTGLGLLREGANLAQVSTGTPDFGGGFNTVPQFDANTYLGRGIAGAGIGLEKSLSDIDFSGLFGEEERAAPRTPTDEFGIPQNLTIPVPQYGSQQELISARDALALDQGGSAIFNPSPLTGQNPRLGLAAPTNPRGYPF
jgi:hypothetical protein